jgi:tetratricopeptide (TPR) repeat protein
VLDREAAPPAESRQIFIGRASEIALLQAALAAARRGSGRLVLVSGPPGIGKSRLAAEFADRVAADGARVLIGRNWEAGGAPAYWPWVQALRSYLREQPQDMVRHAGLGLAELVTLLPEVGQFVTDGASPESTDPVADRFRLFDATATLLRNVAEEESLIIFLDDLQAADVPSLLLLRFLADQLVGSRILIVATYRDVELSPDHPLASTLAELLRAPETMAVALPGLDLGEVSHFLEVAVGEPTRASVAVALHHQTSGNPLFLGEAVRLLESGEGPVTAGVTRLMVPAEIRAVIERRLGNLVVVSREQLEVASIFGSEFEIESIRRSSGGSVEGTLEILTDALGAGLVVEVTGTRNRFRFSHDLIRQTLYAGIAPGRRIKLHRQAAEILEVVYESEIEDHLAELALHHFEAVPGGDPAKAVEYGRRAGDRALRSLAYEEAARLYQMALSVIGGGEGSDLAMVVDLVLSLGDALVRAGDLPEAGEAFMRAAEIARRVPDARRLAQAAVGYGGRFIWARAGGDTRMVPLLQDALVHLGGEDDRLRVRLLSRLACASRSISDRDHSDALSRQALDLARQIDDPQTLIFALTGRAGAVWWPENPEDRLAIGAELVEIGNRVGAIESVVDGHMTRCSALAEMGDIGAARRELETLSRLGGPLRLPAYHWLEGAIRAWFALLQGEFSEVEPWVDKLQRLAPTTPSRDNVSAALFQLFLLRREQGRLDEIKDVVRGTAADFPWYPIHRLALAYLLAVGEDQAGARRILEDLGVDRFARLHRDNYWVPSLCLAAETAFRLEDKETARVIRDLLEPYEHRNAVAFPEGPLGSVARYLGLVAAVGGDFDDALGHLVEAEAANRRMGARPWVAHALFDQACLLASRDRPGDENRVASLLGECLALCSDLAMVGLERKAKEMEAAAIKGDVWPGSAPQEGIFRREGEYFSVAFEGDGFRVKDMKGMRYLSTMLSSPGREIHVLDLVAAAGGVEAGTRGAALDPTSNPAGDDTGPVLDRQARDAYERRLVELEDDVNEAESFRDSERASRARQEKDFLISELAAAVGLGGRDRLAISVAERARVNVTRAIRSAVAKVSDNSSRLGDHLAATIHTGTFCSYRPDPRTPMTWTV